MQKYTTNQWAADGTFSAQVGQEIDAEIHFQMMDAIQPKRFIGKSFLMGEAYDHKGENYAARYMYFIEHNGRYYYGGLVENNIEKIEAAFDNAMYDLIASQTKTRALV